MTEDPVQAVEDLLIECERLLGLFDRQLLRTSEAQSLNDRFRRLKALLPQGGTAYRVLERRMASQPGWLRSTPSGYLAPQDREYLAARVETLKAVAEEFGPEALREIGAHKHQYHVSAGEYGRARRLLFDLMKQAKTSLAIVDPYADETVFPYLESLAPDVCVTILGGIRTKSAVKLILEGYQKGGRKFEFRTSMAFHDRYVILDGGEVWSVGTSINHAGKAEFTISKISDAAEGDRITKSYQLEWSKGQPL